MFQDPASQLVMERVEDDVAFGLENRGWPRAAMRARVPEAIEEAGLEGLGRRRSVHLSGGQQQRLALAGVLAPRPGVLVLDEPTANLDPDGARAFFERLAAIRAARAATIVLVEHRVDLAWPLADRVLALGRDGRPLDLGTPESVVARSGQRLVAEGIWLPERVDPMLPGRAAAAEPRGRSGPVLASAEGVTFAYARGIPVVRDVDLEIRSGEHVALRGPNGGGKSTLGRLLVGLLRPDAGRIRLGRDDPSRLPAAELARGAGYVFQDPERQFLTARVSDEVLIGLRPEERARVPALMAALGLPLEAFGGRSPYTLSGGEERRLSLASTLVRRPRLLVLDEPTFGQDRRGVESLLAILAERVEDGAAVLAITHDERFAAALADRTLVLEAGRLCDGARPQDGAAA